MALIDTLIFRDTKGSNLTPTEGDANLRALAKAVDAAGGATTVHPYYHFHGYAGDQLPDDTKFNDMSGINHASRGANLSISQLWTTNAGYASTIDPASGATDSVLRIPNLNYDYASGEKLIVWWLGKVTAEGSAARMMGDAQTAGWRIALNTSGTWQLTLSGPVTEAYASSSPSSISGALNSIAFAVDGAARKYGKWTNELYQFGTGDYQAFSVGDALDTKNSNTVNMGTSFPASASSTSGIATATRALAILRLPASYPMPSVGTLTSVFLQLRSNPGKLILSSAF